MDDADISIFFLQRRLPWESTTQASLTLALANPVLQSCSIQKSGAE
jgi:hypothetical protein